MTSATASIETLLERLQDFPVQQVATPFGQVAWREAGAMASRVTHVLLHGIGSGSGSWLGQLAQVQTQNETQNQNRSAPALRVLAWDAPGYARSDALPMPAPVAADYARSLWAWLDAVNRASGSAPAPVTLVGHSLGCLMATQAALQNPQRVKQLILLSPAQGYARATPPERDKKLADRLDSLARLGPSGMAHLRGAAMLSPDASAAHIAFVQHTMAQIKPPGYTQAARMLSTGDLLSDLAQIRCPVAVASGSADTITPPAGCEAVAAVARAPYTSLPGAGHACAIEAPDAVSRLIGLAGHMGLCDRIGQNETAAP
jgi:pimeloyl-ACP methyl ester carboxylesterase